MSDEIKNKPKELTDEEAAKASAGASTEVCSSTAHRHYSCSKLPDDEFSKYWRRSAPNRCPDYVLKDGVFASCQSCMNYRVTYSYG